MSRAASIAALSCLAIIGMPAPVAASQTYGDALGSHSMVYLNSTPAQHEAVFRATSQVGLRYLRMDFAVGLVFESTRPDFSAVDRVDALAARYRIRVLGVITTTPWWIADCDVPTDRPDRCPPAAQHELAWRAMVAAVVRRAPHVRHWQLGNEPDTRAFLGTPSAYARWARVTAAGIRDARPDARIALGGCSWLDRRYLTAVLHDTANPLAAEVDIVAVHLRGELRSMRRAASRARAFFRESGVRGPLWVTETGYPSLPVHQWDPALRGGEADQARWVALGPQRLLAGGARAVFVAFRDSPELGEHSPYASEGIVQWPALAGDGGVIAKPAYWALLGLAATTR